MITSNSQTPPAVDEESVSALARKIWEDEGQPEGRAEEHWLKAEEMLRESKAQTSQPSPSASQKIAPKKT
jgi:hypothetical protein